MSVKWEVLENAPRLLIEVALKPMAGSRLQPTGFPDLGPALYEGPDGIPTLLVESAQSMANRLEAVCWDEATEAVVAELKGLPYVQVVLAGLGGTEVTTSLQEFHRLNSPYIMTAEADGGKTFAQVLREELRLGAVARKEAGGEGANSEEGEDTVGVVNLRRLARVCFKYDPNSLVHGVFLEKIAGRLRHQRSLSAFIEARNVRRADSGGVKFDRVMPKPHKGLDAAGGYGNVPFHRTEFTAESITAYFTIDLAQLRGFGLPEGGWQMLAVLSLWKIRRFLETGLRLRTACDLDRKEEGSLVASRPATGFEVPALAELTNELRDLLERCGPHFAKPVVTSLTWTGEKKKAAAGKGSKK